jgi:hypothetical protein
VPASRRSGLTHAPEATFELMENDFTIADRKVAGNAQCVTKGRWLQHTSFLWNFQPERMALLREPARRPEYRGKRMHGAFLAPLVSFGYERQAFVDTIEDALEARGFDLQPASALLVLDFRACLVGHLCALHALRCMYHAVHPTPMWENGAWVLLKVSRACRLERCGGPARE